MLENMGLRVLEEIPYPVKVAGGAAQGGVNVWIHDFGMRAAHGGTVDIRITSYNVCYTKLLR